MRLRTALILFLGAVLAESALPRAGASILDGARFRVEGVVIVWATDAVGGNAIASDFIIDTGTGNTALTSGDTDLIAEDVHTVVTGSLVAMNEDYANQQGAPIVIRRVPGTGTLQADSNGDWALDASDTFDAFAINNNTDTNTRRMEIRSSFYVASNTAFSIDAIASPVGTTTPTQMNRMRAFLETVTLSGDDGLAFGSAAQYPHSDGPVGGRRMNGRTFTNLLTSRPVFRGDQRTAAMRGTLAAQSVRFDMMYRYNSGDIDLADGAFDAEAEIIYTVFIP